MDTESKICPKCSKEISGEVSFCPHCGCPVGQDEQNDTAKEDKLNEEIEKKIAAAVEQRMKEEKKRRSRSMKVTTVIIAVILVIGAAVGALIYNFSGDSEEENEAEAWAQVERFQNEGKTDSLEIALEHYMSDYSDGKHFSMAVQLNERFSQEKTDWGTAQSTKSIESVNAFLDKHPNGLFHEAAMDMLDSLTYDDACDKNSTEAYDAYLTQFPNGKYADEVRRLTSELQSSAITANEELDVIDIITRHFQALATNNKGVIAATLASKINSYIGKADAQEEDVLAYAEKLNEPGKTKSFSVKDPVVTKINVSGKPIYNVKFTLEETIGNVGDEEGANQTIHSFNGAAVVNEQLRISSLVLTE